MLVNKKTLSDVLGVSERSITEWQKVEGFPIESVGGRGASNEYDTGKVIKWSIDREIGRGQESHKERRDRLEGDRLELQLAREYAEVIPAAEIEKAWANLALNIRKTISQGDTKLKGELDVVHGIDIDIEILNEHSRSILDQLSAYEPNDEAGGKECGDEIQAAAESIN